MRTRLVQGTDFTVTTSTITIANHAIDKPSVRLLYDETADVLIASTGVKNNITCSGSVITLVPFDLLNDEGHVIGQYSAFDPNHAYTLAVDYGGGISIPTDYAKEETLNTVGKEVHEIAVGTDFTFVKNAIVSDSGITYQYDGIFVYQPDRVHRFTYYRWIYNTHAASVIFVCTLSNDTKVGSTIYGYDAETGRPTDPTGQTIASFEYDNLETAMMADANKQDILTAINNIPTPVIPNDYAKEDNATNNKLELLNKLNMLINMIGPGDSFANFVAAPNLIYLGTASYDEETNTIYIGEDGYYDENEQTIFING